MVSPFQPEVARYVNSDQVRGMPVLSSPGEEEPRAVSKLLTVVGRQADMLEYEANLWVEGKNGFDAATAKLERLVGMVAQEKSTLYRRRVRWPNRFGRLARCYVDGTLKAVRLSKAGSYKQMVRIPLLGDGPAAQLLQATGWKFWADALLRSTRTTWGLSRPDAAVTLHAAVAELSSYLNALPELQEGSPMAKNAAKLTHKLDSLTRRAGSLAAAVVLS